MNKILLLFLLFGFTLMNAFSMISPENMLKEITNSKIKTPAIVKSVKTVQNQSGNRILEVKFEGLYENAGQKYEAKCRNFKKRFPLDVPLVGVKSYNPKRGNRVFVTIDYNGGEITSLVKMDEKFEKNLQSSPQLLKFDSIGAYFEE